MDVSENSGTPKSSIFNRVFHYKPSILGIPLFLETPIYENGNYKTWQNHLFQRNPIHSGRIPQLFLKLQVPKIKMGSTKMQTSWSKSVPFIVESLEQTNFDSSTISLADAEFLPTQQTSPKRAKVPLLLCALQVAYFIISCCDLNHLPPPSLSTDGNNYRLQDIFSGCKPVFFFGWWWWS